KGSDIAMDVAKMTLVTSDLNSIPKALNLSGNIVRGIRQNLFWKDYFSAQDELEAAYQETYQAAAQGLTSVVSKWIVQGVNAEFEVIPFGQRRASLLELAAPVANEATIKLLLSTLRPTTPVSEVRENALKSVAAQVIKGAYRTIGLRELHALGLSTATSLKLVLDESTSTPESFARIRNQLQVLIALGVNLNEASISTGQEGQLLVTPFAYTIGKDLKLAAYILSLPGVSSDVIVDSPLKSSEKVRAQFVLALARMEQGAALKKVLQTYSMNAFDRMTIAGYLRAEKHVSMAEIVESTHTMGAR
ncbi:MAG: hypothetical protein EOP09_13935, partial [Proteobacteria bacterium]